MEADETKGLPKYDIKEDLKRGHRFFVFGVDFSSREPLGIEVAKRLVEMKRCDEMIYVGHHPEHYDSLGCVTFEPYQRHSTVPVLNRLLDRKKSNEKKKALLVLDRYDITENECGIFNVRPIVRHLLLNGFHHGVLVLVTALYPIERGLLSQADQIFLSRPDHIDEDNMPQLSGIGVSKRIQEFYETNYLRLTCDTTTLVIDRCSSVKKPTMFLLPRFWWDKPFSSL